ncbi:MAG: hypothetical protein WBU20_01170, partial [Candidatus Acidiferrum sp.]
AYSEQFSNANKDAQGVRENKLAAAAEVLLFGGKRTLRKNEKKVRIKNYRPGGQAVLAGIYH